MSDSASTQAASALKRGLGRWDLTAFGVNIVIGSAVFLTPSLIAAQFGNWAPVAVIVAGLAVLCIAFCFAEVGSRFDRTGGPYLYTLAAFGKFLAFEVGWMTWFTRVASQAAIVNGIAVAIGFYAPAMSADAPRVALILGLFLALAWINARGIRQSALLVNTLTLAKLAPLAVFVVIGLFFIDRDRLFAFPPLSGTHLAAGALLLIYAFCGFETVGIPAGESHDPRRHLPFALITTIIAVTVIMVLVQVVAISTLPDIANSKTPVADAALRFMGPAGALMIGIGSIVAMTGNTAGSILAASRMLFALGENGSIPRVFARIHPQHQTPSFAIWFSALAAIALALSGSFAVLAMASAVARLLTYIGVSAATLVLRSPRFEGRVSAPAFVVPLGPTIPVLAVLASLTIIGGATAAQLIAGGAALAAGAVVFGLTPWLGSLPTETAVVSSVTPSTDQALPSGDTAHVVQIPSPRIDIASTIAELRMRGAKDPSRTPPVARDRSGSFSAGRTRTAGSESTDMSADRQSDAPRSQHPHGAWRKSQVAVGCG